MAEAGVNDGDVESGLVEPLLEGGDLFAGRAMEEPTRLVRMKEFGRLALDARRGADDLFDEREIPARSELGDEFGDVARLVGVVELGANAADDEVRVGELAGGDERKRVLERTSAVVREERAGFGRQALPCFLEPLGGF